MYDKVETKLDLPSIDSEMLQFWADKQIFKKTEEQNKGKEEFVFYEGPPGMNAPPHIGHGFTRILKDAVLRYYMMQGKSIIRRAGWDCHGLPVETKAEKNLGIKNKFEIDSVGVQKFVDECKNILNEYESEWRTTTEKLGFWVDMDKAYRTSDNDYVESVWWSLKKLFDQGDIYEGYRVGPYCPRCGTSLSSHEVAQEYKSIQTRTVYVKFELKDRPNTYFLAWTTTPWTLPSNVALAVNPEFEYIEFTTEDCDSHYIMSKNLVGKLFDKYEVVKTYTGKELERIEYKPIFDIPSKLFDDKKAYYVTCADYVTLTDGTGIVHIAPAFGVDDSNVGNEYGLPFLQLVNEKGEFTDDLPMFAGKNNFKSDGEIIKYLKENNYLVKEQTIQHEYPHCWRCHEPLMYYARNGWFIRMSKYRDALVKNNNMVNWHPESAKDGRMGSFLSTAIDWNLSRDRYWGTPLNIWRCDKCGKLHSVGSRKELCELTGEKEIKDLHKPYIDTITFDCDCGGTFKRVSQTIDCWYDSGAMPFAQWHYPFENKEMFESQFPADFICEGKDQTRGWFYTLQAVNTLVFGTTPYKSVIMTGHILDKNGIKMSKSLGNVIHPNDLVNQYGADAVRFYVMENAFPWLSVKLNPDDIGEIQRKTISTLWNTYAFFVLYANIDNFKPNKDFVNGKLTVMDKWLLSKLNQLEKDIEGFMADFDFTTSVRKIADFIEDLSNWYVRRCRERFWVDGVSEDKTIAFNTLYYCLVEISKICAPFMPFVSDKIYKNLTKGDITAKESVHLESYPKCKPNMINESLNEQMQEVIDIVTLGRACRNDCNIKNRQPLSKMMVYSANKIPLNDELIDIIADDLNVKNVLFIENAKEYITFELKPQLKTLGPKYGKDIGVIREFLTKCDSYSLVNEMRANQDMVIKVTDEIILKESDILVYPKSKPDCVAQTAGMITVILDTQLTDDLINEGIMREIISKLQNMRKEAGYQVEDKILVEYSGDEKITDVINKYIDTISTIVLAVSIKQGQNGEMVRDIEINDKKCTLSIKKVDK